VYVHLNYCYYYYYSTEGRKITITSKQLRSKLGSAGRAPSLRVIPWHLPYNWGKSRKNLS
jgi:hypothetical protein